MNLVSFFIFNLSSTFSQETNAYFEFDHRKSLKTIQKIIPLEGSVYKNKLQEKLRKILHITREEAQFILEYYLKEQILIEDHQNDISINILANITRRQIYTFIRNNPGITINKLKTELEIGSHQLLYHLGALLEFKKIKYLQFNKIKAFGISETTREYIIIGFYFLRRNIQDIIKFLIQSEKDHTLAELDEVLEDIPISTLRYCLNNLIRVNLIQVELINEKKIYGMEKLHQEIAQDLLNR